jgi:hypothetical protein
MVRFLPEMVDRHEGLGLRASKRMQPPIRRHYQHAGNYSCFRSPSGFQADEYPPADSVTYGSPTALPSQVSTGNVLRSARR